MIWVQFYIIPGFKDPRYKSDVDEILQYSAGLTDHDKMISEFYDDKFYILQPSLAQGTDSFSG